MAQRKGTRADVDSKAVLEGDDVVRELLRGTILQVLAVVAMCENWIEAIGHSHVDDRKGWNKEPLCRLQAA